MTAAEPQPGQPVVFRNAAVLTIDDSRTILTGADVLISGERIAAGVTTTVDWSHGLQTIDHAGAATDALEEVPGRFVLG